MRNKLYKWLKLILTFFILLSYVSSCVSSVHAYEDNDAVYIDFNDFQYDETSDTYVLNLPLMYAYQNSVYNFLITGYDTINKKPRNVAINNMVVGTDYKLDGNSLPFSYFISEYSFSTNFEPDIVPKNKEKIILEFSFLSYYTDFSLFEADYFDLQGFGPYGVQTNFYIMNEQVSKNTFDIYYKMDGLLINDQGSNINRAVITGYDVNFSVPVNNFELFLCLDRFSFDNGFSDTNNQLNDVNNKLGGIWDAINGLWGAVGDIVQSLMNLPTLIAEKLKVFFQSIVDGLNSLGKQIVENLTNLGNFIAECLNNVKDFLGNLLQNIINGLITLGNFIIDGLKTLFIPKDDFFNSYFNTIKTFFIAKLGFLVYPFTFFVDVANRITNIGNGNGIITIPSFSLFDTVIIKSQSFNLKQGMSNALGDYYELYYAFIDFICVMFLVRFAFNKFNEVLKNTPIDASIQEVKQ